MTGRESPRKYGGAESTEASEGGKKNMIAKL